MLVVVFVVSAGNVICNLILLLLAVQSWEFTFFYPFGSDNFVVREGCKQCHGILFQI